MASCRTVKYSMVKYSMVEYVVLYNINMRLLHPGSNALYEAAFRCLGL